MKELYNSSIEQLSDVNITWDEAKIRANDRYE